jgi:hypothetical protein
MAPQNIWTQYQVRIGSQESQNGIFGRRIREDGLARAASGSQLGDCQEGASSIGRKASSRGVMPVAPQDFACSRSDEKSVPSRNGLFSGRHPPYPALD